MSAQESRGLPSTSFLNHKAFKECRRQWLYRYEPGLIASGPQLWEFIREGRLLPMNALLGRVVDDVITACLRFRTRHDHFPEHPIVAVRKVLADYIRFSEEWAQSITSGGKWHRRPGKQAVDRIYYEHPLEPDEVEEIVKRGEQLVLRWFELPLISEFERIGVSNWRVPESGRTPSFMLGEFRVFAKYDFITVEEKAVKIYDWKTGDVARGEEGAVEQLHGYACYVHHEFDVPYQDIELIAVWLGANYVGSFQVDEALIQSLEANWNTQIQTVGSMLEAVKSEDADIATLFPTTVHTWLCHGCVFRACPNHPHGLGLNQ